MIDFKTNKPEKNRLGSSFRYSIPPVVVWLYPPMFCFPLFLGSARPWFWSLWLACCFIVWTCSGLLRSSDLIETVNKVKNDNIFWIFCLLSLWIAFQILPMPSIFLKIVSPERYNLVTTINRFISNKTSWAFQCSTISYIPRETLFSLLWWLGLAATTLISFKISSSRTNRRYIIYFFYLICGIEAFYGILQVLFPSMGVLWERSLHGGYAYKGIARGTFINRNHFAAFLSLLWPVLLADVISQSKKRFKKKKNPKKFDRRSLFEEMESFLENYMIKLFFVGLVILSLVFSESRAGIITTFLAINVFLFFSGFKSKRVWLFVAFCWGVFFLYGGIIGFGEILLRFKNIPENAGSRIDIWLDGLKAFSNHLLTGMGWGNYPYVEGLYRIHLIDTQRAGHVHCDYLEWAVELGLPGIVFLTTLLWLPWWKFTKNLLSHRNHLDYALTLRIAGILSGMLALLTHAFVDFPFHIPAIFFFFAIMLGMLFRYGTYFGHHPTSLRRKLTR